MLANALQKISATTFRSRRGRSGRAAHSARDRERMGRGTRRVAILSGSVSHLLREGKSASIGAAGGTGEDRGSYKVPVQYAESR